MVNFTRFFAAALLIVASSALYSQTINTRPFHKVIVSPFIEATFIQGDQERVVIDHSIVDPGKLHIETSNGTLRIYLEGAKVVPSNPCEIRNSDRQLYPNRAVSAIIYYKKLDALSLRGEERFEFVSPLSTGHFTLKLYGESAITFAEVHINDLRTAIYGESSVEIQSGSVNRQSYTCYGEGKVNTSAVSSEEAKLTTYGESSFRMNVSERIRITSFGEAKLRYRGNAQIVKGISVGGVDVARLD
ncbi:MAG: DUF2807 domain-containing protein [Chitinophagaceae bacterium]|nr:DUF2807 domain-containing protein [Chitinophagaceae bacterium]